MPTELILTIAAFILYEYYSNGKKMKEARNRRKTR